MGRFLKRVLKLGALAAAAYAVWRYFETRRSESEVAWEARPFPYPPEPRTATAPETAPTTASVDVPWVEPVDGACPGSHPIKAKLTSRIFHVPGGVNYSRTNPDRCYRDPTAAEADGLRQSRR